MSSTGVNGGDFAAEELASVCKPLAKLDDDIDAAPGSLRVDRTDGAIKQLPRGRSIAPMQ